MDGRARPVLRAQNVHTASAGREGRMKSRERETGNGKPANAKRRARRSTFADFRFFISGFRFSIGFFLKERRGWDSNPRYLSAHPLSRRARYNHFGTSPTYIW